MYQTINEVLERQNSDLVAAEAHGLAVGMLSKSSSADAAKWLWELVGNRPIAPADETLLLNLFAQTRQILHDESDEFAFDLFLPDDDEPLSEQAEAIRYWCLGFLFGVGSSHAGSNWPGEAGELIRDIIELTKIDSHVEDEEDANALVEIHEYLRAAVFTIRDYFLETEHRKHH